MKSGLITAALAGMISAGSSFAANAADLRNDGNELLGDCKEFLKEGSNFNAFQAGKCVGLIRGVTETVYFYRGEVKKGDRFCEASGVTNGQRVRIVVKFLEDNPKLLNEYDVALIWKAFYDAYPCK
ncbi:Rap1a/Tai family immunity protein [Pseudomonas sp.]|uniref:Rap1a/Tai family immunity protein n=1 Tax=Pseudomonas sp. TaxID=306 RepID=UPI0029BEFA77|nr:Rap1a/Tai family immunity protein [Pseudomonas sp.]MDX3743730.1 Rap1a/Tai family immunity protein [Pseudomonas sp.]